MTDMMIEYLRKYMEGRINALVFSESYIELYKIFRQWEYVPGNDTVDELLSTAFTASDNYSPSPNRRESEFNDQQLHDEISMLINEYDAAVK